MTTSTDRPARVADDSTGRATGGPAAWVTAGVLVVVVAALVLALVRSIAVGNDNDRTAGRLLRPTTEQLQAVQAGATIAANLTTLSRKNFDADYARALAGVTGKLRSDLLAHKASYLSAMTAGKFDLKAVPVTEAFESESDGKVLMLVTLNGYHVVDNLNDQTALPQRIELTMVRSGNAWLASDFTQVGVQ